MDGVCRICLEREGDPDAGRLLRPCRCRGTQLFIHEGCLRKWRMSDAIAFHQCKTCLYHWKFSSAPWYQSYLTNENTSTALTLVAIGAVCFLIGYWAILNGMNPFHVMINMCFLIAVWSTFLESLEAPDGVIRWEYFIEPTFGALIGFSHITKNLKTMIKLQLQKMATANTMDVCNYDE